MSTAVLNAIKSKFASGVRSAHSHCGDDTVVLDRKVILDVARYLKSDKAMAFNMPIDCTAVDYLDFPGGDAEGSDEKRGVGGFEGARFEVVYHLYSTTRKHRIRLKVALDESDVNTPSLTQIWLGMDWFEREAWDMYGIRFDGHPDLRRILLYEEFVGHPLRKDYPLRGYQPLVPIAKLDRDNEDPKLVNTDLNPEAPE
jgi:NADH-quinone oxidoreductase subunit C